MCRRAHVVAKFAGGAIEVQGGQRGGGGERGIKGSLSLPAYKSLLQ